MISLVSLKLWPLLVTSVFIRNIIGGLYFGPLAGQKWGRYVAADKSNSKWMEDMDVHSRGRILWIVIFGTLMSFFRMYIMAQLFFALQVATIVEAIKVSLCLFCAFELASNLDSDLWAHRPFMLTVLNALHTMIDFLASGVMIVVWSPF
eukprot:TRINITY_DN9020_c0_g1_i1.p1 TRINITY_DN9020_c0_g1~~TRINITY_DN9020_c0_g1_i1.p1  ORF type:complete len:165 (+),score=8.96 TRINITY_DN9020_c0_g1_i1:49-495(+)